jgi:hypothetical protein
MSAEGTLADAFDRAGLHIETQQFFLFRPEFQVRYGLASWTVPLVHRVPVVREITTLGA